MGEGGARPLRPETREAHEGGGGRRTLTPAHTFTFIFRLFPFLSFDTAVEEAQRSLLAAKVEASSTARGVGLVRLMGRQSGYIAMNASMASGVVDLCLIPEVPFTLPALTAAIERVLGRKGHAVVCVAEGAGQDIIEAAAAAAATGGSSSSSDGGATASSASVPAPGTTDASGNPILSDVGTFLKGVIKARVPGADVKYIDPSYMIRAVPTNSSDRIYCKVCGRGEREGRERMEREGAVACARAGRGRPTPSLFSNLPHLPLSLSLPPPPSPPLPNLL